MLVLYAQPQLHFNGVSQHTYDYEALLARQYQLEQERRLRIERQRQYELQQQRLREARERQAKEAELRLLTALIASAVQENPAHNNYLTSGRYEAPLLSIADNQVRHGQCSCHGDCSGPSCFNINSRRNPFLTHYPQPPRPSQFRVARAYPEQQPRRQSSPKQLEAFLSALSPVIQFQSDNEQAREYFPDPDLFDVNGLLSMPKVVARPKKVETPAPRPVLKKVDSAPKPAAQEQVRHVTFEDIIKAVMEQSKKEFELRNTKSAAAETSATRKDDAAAKPALNRVARDPAVSLERKPALRKNSTPNPAPAQSTASPSAAPPSSQPKSELEAQKEAEAAAAAAEQARLIRRYDSLSSLSTIRSDFLTAQEKVTGSPRSTSVDLAADNEETEVVDATPSEPSHQSPLDAKIYEETLLRLLERLDGVESDGDDVIRFTRRSLARELADELEALDKYKAEVKKIDNREAEAASIPVAVEPVQSEVIVQSVNIVSASAPVPEPVTSVFSDAAHSVAEVEITPKSVITNEVDDGTSLARSDRPTTTPPVNDSELKEEIHVQAASTVEEPRAVSTQSAAQDLPEANIGSAVNDVVSVEQAEPTIVSQDNLSPTTESSVAIGIVASVLPTDEATAVQAVEEEAELSVLPIVHEPKIEEESIEDIGHTFPPSTSAHNDFGFPPSSAAGATSIASESSYSPSHSSHASEVDVEHLEASPALTGIGSDVVVLSDEEDEDKHSEVSEGHGDSKFELL